MVNVLLVCAHPEEKSFTHAMKNEAIEEVLSLGFNVEVSDLYAQNFYPVGGKEDFLNLKDCEYFHYQSEQLNAAITENFVPPIAKEQEKLMQCDLLILVFPLWWGGMPAIMKGWFERVLAYGVAYADGQRFDNGFFVGRKSLIGVTTGGTVQRFSEGDVYGPIENLLYPINRCMFEYIGLESIEPFVAYASPRVSDEIRKEYLTNWRLRIKSVLTDGEWIEKLNGLEPPIEKALRNRNQNWNQLQ